MQHCEGELKSGDLLPKLVIGVYWKGARGAGIMELKGTVFSAINIQDRGAGQGQIFGD